MKTKYPVYITSIALVIFLLVSLAESVETTKDTITTNSGIIAIPETFAEESLTTELKKNLSYYASENVGGISSIFYLLRLGYPKHEENGVYSTTSISSSLIKYFKINPIKAFDIAFKSYPLIKTIVGNDSQFYSLLAFYVQTIAETDFKWKVIKNPTYLNGDYNSYSEIVFANPKIEALGAKRESVWYRDSETNSLFYRNKDRSQDMKWRMIKFFHRRGPFFSNLAGYYILKILREEAKINDSAIPAYIRSYVEFSDKYNKFASRWNAGDEIENPYRSTGHRIHLNEYKKIQLPSLSKDQFEKTYLKIANIDFLLESGKGKSNYIDEGTKELLCDQYRKQRVEITSPEEMSNYIEKNPVLEKIPAYGEEGQKELLVVFNESWPLVAFKGFSINIKCEDITSDGNPELIATINTRGGNASEEVFIFSPDDLKILLAVDTNRFGQEILDLNGDGVKEVKGWYGDREWHEFATCAGCQMPPRKIFCFEGVQYTDCTTKFPKLLWIDFIDSKKRLKSMTGKYDQIVLEGGSANDLTAELAYFLGTSIKLNKEEMAMAYIDTNFSKEVMGWAKANLGKIREKVKP
jgi:hypothetical protein